MKRSFTFVGTDEFRPAICTVLINVKKNYIDIVSTDMFRLFINRKEVESINSILKDKAIMLSEVAASILYQFLSDREVEIVISTDGVRTFLCFDSVIISDMNVEQIIQIMNTYVTNLKNRLVLSLIEIQLFLFLIL